MTKSIEQQGEQHAGDCDTLKKLMEAATKSRDAEWLKVVNELKDCAQDIIKNKMVHPFEFHHYNREDMAELLKVALIKADQMMKEMGVRL